jgi:2-oxo-4-hydroxy-4-carboxy-5-ureidoimidazoline decarboxylase
MAMTLAAVNGLSPAAFISAFGDVAEHSPWVAEGAAALRPYANREAMIAAFAEVVAQAPEAQQLALIRSHPDLAGRAAVAGEMAADSKREQAGAGLGALTPEEFRRFAELNRRYRDTFGFPFIFAVRGATKSQILEAFEARIGNAPAREFATALAEIHRIFRFRIEERVLP